MIYDLLNDLQEPKTIFIIEKDTLSIMNSPSVRAVEERLPSYSR